MKNKGDRRNIEAKNKMCHLKYAAERLTNEKKELRNRKTMVRERKPRIRSIE